MEEIDSNRLVVLNWALVSINGLTGGDLRKRSK